MPPPGGVESGARVGDNDGMLNENSSPLGSQLACSIY